MNFSNDSSQEIYIFCNETAFDSDLLVEFILNGILLNGVGILGIIGNIISMIILTRPQMKSSINYLLTGLARCDTVLIMTSIILFGIPAIYKYTSTPILFSYYYRVYPFLTIVAYPTALIAHTMSVYLTLTVTIERFVAVCHPLRARSLCTYGRARIYVLIIIMFSFLYNITRFMEVTIMEIDMSSLSALFPCIIDEEREMTLLNMTLYKPEPTELRQNPAYISIYINWLYLLFIYVIPFSLLAVLNTAIYKQVRRANKERQRLSRLQKKEIGLATMLLCVVIVFVLCNILALVTNILESFYDIILDKMVKTSNLLVTINSSVNFIIYVIFGEKFKRLFVKLYCSNNSICFCGTVSSMETGTVHEDSLMLSNGDMRRSLNRLNGSNSGKRTQKSLTGVYYPNGPNDTTTSTNLNAL